MTIFDERIRKATAAIERQHAAAAQKPLTHPPMLGLMELLSREVTQETDGHMRGCARDGLCHCATWAGGVA